MATEREYKFAVTSDWEAPSVDGLCVAAAPTAVEQTATYYDTPDLRLARAGASLRFRSDDGWTVKLPEASGGPLERDEIGFGFGDSSTPPPEAVSLVHALARTAPLHEVATVRTERREITLLDLHGKTLGVIDDDRVRGSARSGAEVAFHEVEFEIADGADADAVETVVARLRRTADRDA